MDERAWHRRTEHLRSKLRALREPYAAAKREAEAQHLSEHMRAEFQGLRAIAQRYLPGSEATGAVYALAQIAYRLEQVLAPWDLLASYEEQQERLRLIDIVQPGEEGWPKTD